MIWGCNMYVAEQNRTEQNKTEQDRTGQDRHKKKEHVLGLSTCFYL